MLKEAVELAAGRIEVVEMISDLYARVQQAIDQRKPACAISGKCCRFEEYGHRLYVTTLELAAFVAREGEVPAEPRFSPPGNVRLGGSLALPTLVSRPWNGAGCPFQVNKLCSVHAIRPFGCRMFFCDPTATEWQNDAYERFHAELKALHERLGVPYYYVEWRHALVELGLATVELSAGETSF